MKIDPAPGPGEILSAGLQMGMICPGDRILVALSGGADSVALLAALRESAEALRIEVAAAHLNHGLRGEESERDERFSGALCAGWDIPFVSERRCVTGRGKGLESAAREIRYAFLNRSARALSCNKIATAHTADDNAETILINLLRGTGIRGLCGIPPVRENVIRPMLDATRAGIERFLELRGLSYVTDSSNMDTVYTRNRIRHEILPILKAMNPKVLGGLRGMSGLLTEDADALDAAALERMDASDGLSVKVAALMSAPRAIASRILRQIGRNAGVPELTRAQVQAVLCLAESKNPSAEVHLPGGIAAKRRYGEILFEPHDGGAPSLPVEHSAGILSFGSWRIRMEREEGPFSEDRKNTVYLRPELEEADFSVRARLSGDAISPVRRGWTKSLKRLYIDCKIPREERSLRPVLTYQGEVAAIPGFPPDRAFAAPAPPAIKITFFQTEE